MRTAERGTVAFGAVVMAGGALLVAISAPRAAGGATDPLQAAIVASAAPGRHWTPEAASFGVARRLNVPVRMADGTVLRADIAMPTDLETGRVARGRFPVLLTQTPYGKESAGLAGSSAIGIDPYFVRRGYLDVAVDVRGTGASGGTFTLFDPKQVSDGVALVRWAAALPHSSGKVGLHGASYLGIDQMLTAGAVGRHSPVKAIFPIVSANDLYRDTSFMGGIPDVEFDATYLGALLPLVNLVNPALSAVEDPASLPDAARAILQHLHNTFDYNARFLLRTYLGGPDSYDNASWHVRSPGTVLRRIVANGIPAYLVGGEYDLFQRGEPLNYAGLQNAAAGRTVTAPMVAGQRVSGRYQLLNGPFTHLGAALPRTLDVLELEWFDTWLRGAHTGMAHTPTPLHYYDLGTKRYAETTTYPLPGTAPRRYYFSGRRSGTALSGNDGTLSRVAPQRSTGADRVRWAPLGSSVCDRSVDQWMTGAFTLVTDRFPRPVPCFADDRLGQTGPTALTYTTAPFARARTLAGPIAATIYARANTRETELVVNIEDVAPNGTSRPLTQGALLGSARTLNRARSWRVDGKTLLPYHPYTARTAVAVREGAVTRYEIEVFPTYATIEPGHRIRVTVDTTDFPHLVPTPPQLLKLLGGSYQVQRTATAPSSITLPLLG